MIHWIKNRLLFAILACCGAWGEIPALQQIPPADRQAIEDFFRNLLAQGEFALTLFGHKPASSFEYPLSWIVPTRNYPRSVRWVHQRKGWLLWEKYKNLFPIKNHLFLRIDNPNYLEIIFAHAEKAEKTLEQRNELFSEFLSGDPMAHPLHETLRAIFSASPALGDSYLAFGAMFGFPWGSCQEFQEMARVEFTLDYFPYDDLESPFTPRKPVGFLLDGYPENLFQKRERYRTHFIARRAWEDNPFFCTFPHSYRSFEFSSDEEINALLQKIIDLHNSDRFLEDFIALLIK